MSYANPGFAPWLLLIALPLVIHLLTRQASRACPLPTFRFLQRSLARQSRLFRLRHLLLLLLRTALVLLLVLTFLKPMRPAPLAAAGKGRRAVVLVLDVSLSLGYRSGGVTSLQKAQTLALRTLDSLQPGDRANVILAGASPLPALSQPAADTGTLKQAVQTVAPTAEKADVPAAVALAADQLAKAEGSRRELYLISDFQRTNWADVRLDALPPGTRIVFVGSDENERDNMAVTGLRLRPAMPRANEEITVLAEIWNGSRQMRSLPVTLRAGDLPPQVQTVTIPPFATATAAFFLPPLSPPGREGDAGDAPPRLVCEASVPHDSLPDDDTRRLAVDLQRGLIAYLLTDENPEVAPSGSYYVSRALDPIPGHPGGIRVIPRRAASLTDTDLHQADAVLLCNVTTLPADRLPALDRYVRNGGALIVFLYGERIQAQMEALNRLAGRGEGLPFLPTTPLDVRGKGKGYVTLSEARFESRLLRVFKDPAAADLGSIRFFRYRMTTEPDGRAEVLLTFEDGTPAVARRALGAGSVLLCNFSPAPADSDLARQEVFPPLLHEFLKGLTAREGDRREFYAGGAASALIPPTRAAVTATAPDGALLPVTVDRTGGGIILERAGQTGLYTITAGGREAAILAVNPHPDESDLRTIDPRELQSAQDRRPAYLVGAAGTARMEDLTRSRPLWPYLLVAAFALLIAEQWVAGMGARSKTG